MKGVLTLAVASTTLFVASPALAQAGGYYRAVAAAPVAKSMLVTRDTVWRCTDATCTAPKGSSRDAIMCELVAQRTGALASFAVNGTEFDAAALEKCNARAK